MQKSYTMLAIQESFAEDFLQAEASALTAMGSGEDRPESELLSTLGAVSVIEIKGQLTNKNSYYNSWYGLISYDAIREAIIEAVENPGCKLILFDIDSPGGAVAGLEDLSSFIRNLDVRTITHTSGTMASAGYMLGASSDDVFASGMSESGSIGVLMQHSEVTKALSKEGVKVDLIRSGPEKAIGGRYEKLTAANRGILQSHVDDMATQFFSFVSEVRGLPLPTMTEIQKGGTFIGAKAVMAGLIDKVASFDETVAYAVNLAQKELDKDETTSDYYRNNHLSTGPVSDQGGQQMAKKFSKEALAAMVKPEEVKPEAEAVKPEAEAVKPEAEAVKPEEVIEPDTAELDALTAELDALTAELDALTGKLEEVQASAKVMTGVISGQIDTMRVAMSLSSVDMSEWAADAVMTEYNAISESFAKSLPVGGVVPKESSDTDKHMPTRAEANAIKNLDF